MRIPFIPLVAGSRCSPSKGWRYECPDTEREVLPNSVRLLSILSAGADTGAMEKKTKRLLEKMLIDAEPR